MHDTYPKSGKRGRPTGCRKIDGKHLSNQRDTGFYENQNLIGDEDRTRMNDYSKPGTSARSRIADPNALSYPITRYRSRRP